MPLGPTSSFSNSSKSKHMKRCGNRAIEACAKTCVLHAIRTIDTAIRPIMFSPFSYSLSHCGLACGCRPHVSERARPGCQRDPTRTAKLLSAKLDEFGRTSQAREDDV